MLTIPPVVKQQKGEDDDELMIVGVTPPTIDPPLIKEVKEVPSPPRYPNRGAGMKEVSEDGSSSQKTPEEAQEENVAGEAPPAEKPEEAELADEEWGGFFFKHKLHRRNRSWQERLKTQIRTVKK